MSAFRQIQTPAPSLGTNNAPTYAKPEPPPSPPSPASIMDQIGDVWRFLALVESVQRMERRLTNAETEVKFLRERINELEGKR